MILTCPACATSYFVPDEAIGPNGRRVRCRSCGNDWRATLEDEPLELSPDAAPVTEIMSAIEDATPDAPATLAETPAPELPRAFRAQAERKRRVRRAATMGAVWAAVAIAVLTLVGAAFVFRLQIAQAVPRAAGVYKMLGAPVNLAGLEFEAFGMRLLPHDPSQIVISGAVRNIRDNEVVAPPIRVALLDEKGREIGHRITHVKGGAPVLPGKTGGFALIVANPDGKVTGAGVDFVLERDDRSARAVPPAPRIEQAAARPSRRIPPPADEGGLRRATAYDLSPVDAQPLDSGGAKGLSAVNG